MSLSSMLESTGTLKRSTTVTRDRSKGKVLNFATVEEDIPCSVQEAGANIMMAYQQRNTRVDTIVYFDRDPGAKVDDLFEVDDTAGTTHKYQVQGESQPVLKRTIAGTEMWSMPCFEMK